jgi:hypothetical protein
LNEKTSRFDTGPDLMILDYYQSSRNINFVYSSSDSAVRNLLDAVGLEEFVKLSLESAIRDFEKEYRTIEDPSMMSIDGRETGTFLFTEQDKYDDYAVKFAKQMWISDVSDEIYVFTFIAPTNSFDSPENIDIRDHFINSIKFLGESELGIEPQQKSRFD